MSSGIDVVVPVYRGLEGTRECLSSVFSQGGQIVRRIIVVNDSSPEPEIALMLEGYRRVEPRLIVLTNSKNLGFVSSANRGLLIRERDVLLLNSDTVVTEGAIEEMVEVGTDRRVAAVVPLSNNGTLASVPDFCVAHAAEHVPAAAVLQDNQLPRATSMPTGVGFCMLMKDIVLNLIGAFDPIYGRGYNEENDWCARARQHGFNIVRSNRALVYHLGGVSFGVERDRLERRNAGTLRRRYPNYLAENDAFAHDPEAHMAANFVRSRLERIGVELVPFVEVAAPGWVNALSRRAELEVRIRVPGGEPAVSMATRSGLRKSDSLLSHFPCPPDRKAHSAEFFRSIHPTVVNCPDVEGLRRCQEGMDYSAWKRRRAFTFAALQGAQCVAVGSKLARELLCEELPLDPAQIAVISQGIEEDWLCEREPEDRAPYLVAIAGADSPSELFLAIEGFSAWRAQAGDLKTRLRILEEAEVQFPRPQQLDVDGVDRVRASTEEERKRILSGAKAVLFLSRSTSRARSLLEALACGCPLVASPLGLASEVSPDATLFLERHSWQDVARAIQTLVGNEVLRRSLSAEARSVAGRCTWSMAAGRWVETYQAVLSAPNRAAFRRFTEMKNLMAAM